MATKKRSVLLVLPSYRIGGTTVCTLHLMELLADSYDFYILALDDSGSMKPQFETFPSVSHSFLMDACFFSNWRSRFSWPLWGVVGAIRYLRNNSVFFKRIIVKRIIKKCKINGKYDTVVSCEEGFTTYFTSHISCLNLVAWVRSDYQRFFSETLNNIKESHYAAFKSIICVSLKTSEHFCEIYPEYASRVHAIADPHSEEYIRGQSLVNDEDKKFVDDCFTIVSVGRIDPVKRFSSIPQIASEISKINSHFKWYVIGSGGGDELTLIQNNILKYQVSEQVVFLGPKLNPNYYIGKADLYVCTSYSEACPGVVNESKILGTPVLSTDYPSIYEFIENNETGWVTSFDNLQEKILELMKKGEDYQKVKTNIALFHFNNAPLIEQLKELL